MVYARKANRVAGPIVLPGPREDGVRVHPVTPLTATAPELDPADSDATKWRDAGGKLVALSIRAEGWHWLRIAGVGVFRFPVQPEGAGEVRAEHLPEPGLAPEVTTDFLIRTVAPLALQAYGYEVLHASCVGVAGSGSVALCGAAESGKSTVAHAMAAGGHRLIADDTLVVDAARRLTMPLPARARLRPSSADHFGAPSKGEVLVTDEGWTGSDAAPVPFTCVVLLSRGADELKVRRLEPGEAFKALLHNAFALRLADQARKRTMLKSYLSLVKDLPVLELAFPDGLEHLASVCEALEALAGP